MQRTGLIIKVSIALVGVMGSAFAQNWHAHAHDKLYVTAIPQEDSASVETPVLAAPLKGEEDHTSVKHSVKKSASPHGKTNSSTVTPECHAIDFRNIVNSDPSEMAEISPEVALIPQVQNEADLLDASRAAAILPALAEQPHTSPVPEASTSLGFGGMLVMGVGLMLFSSWKRSQKQ